MPVSIMTSVNTILHQEGVLAFWKGNAAVCVRIVPYSAIQYVTYDYFKALIYPPGTCSLLQRRPVDHESVHCCGNRCVTYHYHKALIHPTGTCPLLICPKDFETVLCCGNCALLLQSVYYVPLLEGPLSSCGQRFLTLKSCGFEIVQAISCPQILWI